MEFSTKFGYGDTVFYLAKEVCFEYAHGDCKVCGSVGKVTLNGERFKCPKCGDKTTLTASYSVWKIGGIGQVCGVRFVGYDKGWGHRPQAEGVSYFVTMPSDFFDESDLFLLGYEADAQAEVDRRNAVLLNK